MSKAKGAVYINDVKKEGEGGDLIYAQQLLTNSVYRRYCEQRGEEVNKSDVIYGYLQSKIERDRQVTKEMEQNRRTDPPTGESESGIAIHSPFSNPLHHANNAS